MSSMTVWSLDVKPRFPATQTLYVYTLCDKGINFVDVYTAAWSRVSLFAMTFLT